MVSGDDVGTSAPVVVLELDDETAPAPTTGSRADVLLVAHGVPLARRVLPTTAHRLDGGLVRAQLGPSAAARHVRLRLLPPPELPPGPVTAALVIAVDAPGPRLARCLGSVADLAPAVTQVVLVDTSGDPAAVRRHADEHAFGYLRPRPGAGTGLASAGLLAAEELGLEDLLLLVDGAARLDPRWAGVLHRTLADPAVVAATGLVLADVGGGQPSGGAGTDPEAGLDAVRLEGGEVLAALAAVTGAGVAVAVRRSELLVLGRARRAALPEGTAMLDALLAAGGRVAHQPAALAFSGVPAGRRPLGDARRRAAVGHLRRRVASAAGGGGGAPGTADDRDSGWLDRLLAARPQPGRADSRDRGLPRLSVVIPSRGRRDSVVRLVRRLQEQDYDDDRVQLVVALDGDLDGSAAALRSLDLRRRPHVVQVDGPSRDPAHGRGAGAARNAGAAEATGDVLLFLDDDVDPVDRSLLLAHARGHADQPGAARVGLCPPRPSRTASRLEQAAHRWWVDQSMRLLRHEELGCTDVATANLSVPREAFLALGGFVPLPRREDWELGQRLTTSGIPVLALPEAAVLHELSVQVPTFLADVRREGAGDAGMAELHPAVVGLLPLHAWRTTTPRRRRAMRALLEHRTPAGWGPTTGDVALRALALTASPQRWHRALGLSVTAAYWSGVGDALGGLRRLTALFDAADGLAQLGCGRFDAATGELRLPAPHQVAELDVVLGAAHLGRLPVRCGGVPFRRELFVDAVLRHWTPQVLAGRALAAPVPGAASSPVGTATTTSEDDGR